LESHNKAFFWTSERTIDYLIAFLKRKKEVDKCDSPDLAMWLERFEKNKQDAALSFWHEIHRGMLESFIGGNYL